MADGWKMLPCQLVHDARLVRLRPVLVTRDGWSYEHSICLTSILLTVLMVTSPLSIYGYPIKETHHGLYSHCEG